MKSLKVEIKVTDIAPVKKLVDYFGKEVSEGKKEFRLVFTDDETVYIHPIGKDGETYDIDLKKIGEA